MNERFSLWSKFLNHSRTLDVFFHWLICVFWIMMVLISSRMRLLIMPISDLEGLIMRHVGCAWNSGLWSSKVTNASLSARFSMRLSNPSFSATLADWEFNSSTTLGLDFFYVFVTFLIYISMIRRGVGLEWLSHVLQISYRALLDNP